VSERCLPRRRGNGITLVAAVVAGITGCGGAKTTSFAGVSSTTPFGQCGMTGQGRGTLTVDSEVEPSLAAAPGLLVGAYQQDRWSTGQARGIVAVSSTDGGVHWQHHPLPLSKCVHGGPDFPRIGDPWVSLGDRGHVYVIATGEGVAVTTSRDGGAHWFGPTVIERSTKRYFDDKPSITADPQRRGVAFAVWSRLLQARDAPPVLADAVYAVTRDYGRTWSRPRVLVQHTDVGGAVGSQIVIDPRTETIYHFATWEQDGLPGLGVPARILMQRSRDGGRTWSAPRLVLTVLTAGYRPLGLWPTTFVRTAVELADYAVDPTSGTLYATWQDSRFSHGQMDEVALARSTDGGRTWSAPTRVNKVRRPSLIPAIEVSTSGAVGVTYYSATVTRHVIVRFDFAVSTNRGASFATRIIAGPSDLRRAPQVLAANGRKGAFVGDYMGLAASGKSSFAMLFSLPNAANRDPSDVFFAHAP
jgi:hypothetical protein